MRDITQATREESQWRVLKERALEKYRHADSVRISLTVDYLKALAGERDIRKDKGEVEYYINEFDDMAVELVKMWRLTRYDRMVLYLEGLPVKIVRKVYEEVKMDTKKLETFKRLGVFNEVVETALNHNCISKMYTLPLTLSNALDAQELLLQTWHTQVFCFSPDVVLISRCPQGATWTTIFRPRGCLTPVRRLEDCQVPRAFHSLSQMSSRSLLVVSSSSRSQAPTSETAFRPDDILSP